MSRLVSEPLVRRCLAGALLGLIGVILMASAIPAAAAQSTSPIQLSVESTDGATIYCETSNAGGSCPGGAPLGSAVVVYIYVPEGYACAGATLVNFGDGTSAYITSGDFCNGGEAVDHTYSGFATYTVSASDNLGSSSLSLVVGISPVYEGAFAVILVFFAIILFAIAARPQTIGARSGPSAAGAPRSGKPVGWGGGFGTMYGEPPSLLPQISTQGVGGGTAGYGTLYGTPPTLEPAPGTLGTQYGTAAGATPPPPPLIGPTAPTSGIGLHVGPANVPGAPDASPSPSSHPAISHRTVDPRQVDPRAHPQVSPRQPGPPGSPAASPPSTPVAPPPSQAGVAGLGGPPNARPAHDPPDRFCTQCGYPRTAGGRFCGKCGAAFEPFAAESPQPH